MSDVLRLCFIDINANSKAIFSLNNYITKQNLKDGCIQMKAKALKEYVSQKHY